MAVTTAALLAIEFARVSPKVISQGRGALASRLDRSANAAQQRALSLYNPYGRGMAGAAGTYRARMSRDKRSVTGYVFADDAAFFQEYGTARHPAQPAITTGIDEAVGSFVSEMSNIVSKL